MLTRNYSNLSKDGIDYRRNLRLKKILQTNTVMITL